MPIKFRCPHCEQFLGISRSRAGAVTDCPMCGRSIRVPLLDGSVEPLEDPQLNLQDRGLASALDKLAALVTDAPRESLEPAVPRVAEPLRSVLAEAPAPVPLPEPIELAPSPVRVVAEPEANSHRDGPTTANAAARGDPLAALAELDAPAGGSRSWGAQAGRRASSLVPIWRRRAVPRGSGVCRRLRTWPAERSGGGSRGSAGGGGSPDRRTCRRCRA